MRRVVLVALAAALAVAGGCRRAPALTSAWRPMPSRQFSYPADAVPRAIEIRDAAGGWVEQIAVKWEASAAERGPGVSVRYEEPAAPADAARVFFLAESGNVATSPGTDLERADRLSAWLADRIAASAASGDARASDDASADDGDSVEMFRRTVSGAKFTCTTTATIYYDLARAAGLAARRVELAVRPGSRFETHALVEVRPRELGRWIVVDPFFNHRYTLDGAPASALELHDALAAGGVGRVGVVRIGGRPGVDANAYRIDPLAYFRTVGLRTPDGLELAYRGVGDPISPVADPAVVQTDDPAPFRADHMGRVSADAKVRRPSERVTVQALGGRVYVCLTPEAFATGTCEMRSDDGADPAFAPDVAPYTLDDALVVSNDAIDTGAWRTEDGRIEPAEDGGTAVESGDAPCRVAVPFAAPEGATFVAFCDAKVTAGSGTFGIAGRRAFATVALWTGGRMVVSSPILRARDEDTVVVELGPHSRAVVYAVTIRRARGLADVLGHGSPPTPPPNI